MFHNLCLILMLTAVLRVLTIKRMTYFIHANVLKAPNALENYLKTFHATHKPLTEKYLVMLHLTHQQHSTSQRPKWVLVRGNANLVGSRNFLGYITIQSTDNFYSLCHSRLENLQSFFLQKQQM